MRVVCVCVWRGESVEYGLLNNNYLLYLFQCEVFLLCHVLKKHLTSSVVLERGCSTGIPFTRLNPLRHCLVSISAAKAMSVSLVNPLTSLSGLKIIFKCQVSLSMLCGINTYRLTSNRLKSFCPVEYHGIRSLTINSKNSAHNCWR